jgi:branched-chain amino acid transport system ATP-binding protein
MTALLTCDDVTKRFGGITALDGFDVTVPPGRLTGIIGPNGAGKTTFFNVVTGVHAPDEGTIRFEDAAVTGRTPHEVCRSGIARTFQTPQPIRSLTVAENLRVARAFGGGDPEIDVDELLERLGLAGRRNDGAGALQMVEQKYVDLGRALMTDPRLVLLDEILAGLNASEKDEMIATVRTFHREFGVDFLVVEHDLRAIRTISDTVVVMNEGRFMTAGEPAAVLSDERVQEAYVGT